MSSPQTPSTHAISRRDTMKWLGAAGALAALGRGTTALADAPPTTAPATVVNGGGFYRTMLGQFEVTVVSDGMFPFGEIHPTFGANVDKPAVEAALAAAFVAPDQAFGQVNTLVVKAGDAKVLIDTGIGKLFGPATGFVPQNLVRAGIQPADITHLIFSHLHPDHVGGALTADDKPLYPNAKVFVHKDEFAFWTGDMPDFSKSTAAVEMQKMSIDRARKTLDAYRAQITSFEGPKTEILPGITAHLTAGHTPGHVSIEIASDEKRVIYLGDLTFHHAINFPHPEWYVAFDTDRDAAVARRKEVYAKLASERVLFTASHLPFPGLGHLRKTGEDAYDYVPAPWMW